MKAFTQIISRVALLLPVFWHAVVAADDASFTTAQASRCCAALESILPHITYSQTDQKDLYEQSVASYFSVQDRLTPTCIISPTTSKQVSQIVSLLSKKSCQFAIRSGGHGLKVGSSNIVTGATIDLSRMNSVSLSKDKTYVTVGAGSKWNHVYEVIEPLGYSIPGGRAGDVGVGGLTSGGGNSFFAARYGLVCDNVKNFEVVLGDGSIVNANNNTNSDLFQALKGSQNNLGVITSFEYFAFEQGPLWGGTAIYNASTVEAQIKAFVDFTDNIENDPYGSLILDWIYLQATDDTYLENIYDYTRPYANNATEFPPAFKGFSNDSAVGKPVNNSLRVAPLSNLIAELNSPANLGNLYATLTFSNNLTVLQHVTDIIGKELHIYKSDPDYTYASVQFQPLPRLFTDHSLMRGGNVLGLDRYHDNNILFLLDIAWNGSQYDSHVRKIADKVMTEIADYLHSEGALKEFQYINYAFQDQDPLGGYGTAALDKIRAASQKYDPGQVFQKLVPGGWKLGTAGKGTGIGLP